MSRLYSRLLTHPLALSSRHSHAQHTRLGKRAVATPAFWYPPFVHRCTPFPSPSGSHGIHQYAGVLGPRRDTRSHQFLNQGSFRRSMGTHRKNGRSASCQHYPYGASPRQHFCIRRFVDLVPICREALTVKQRPDLSPLSYVAGTLIGNPSIRVFDGPLAFGARNIVSSREALAKHKIEPIVLGAKEHLGILNGTAFSASVAALALNEAVHLALLAQICTAMGTEALLGVRGNYAPFIHEVARPHPGQVGFLAHQLHCP